MNREELKNVVSEILGSSDELYFNQFLSKIASSIKGKQALKLNGIGHFQIKKEPLSRMERKAEGDISEKDILLFLPEGKFGEENIISLDIDSTNDSSSEFSDSVFDVSINKPTIISDSDDEVFDEEEEKNDKLLKNINEFIESGDIVEDYELLDRADSDNTHTVVDETVKQNTKEIIIEDFKENNEDFTEAEINKEFLNESGIEDNDDYEITSSTIEPEITKADLDLSEEGIEEVDSVEGDSNPFDELDNYIKEENTDEAQEIIDAELEQEVNEDAIGSEEANIKTEIEEPKKAKKLKQNEWYKNPILYIATLSFIAAVVVLFIFWPSSDEPEIANNENTEANSITKQYDFGVVDSTVSEDTLKNALSNISETELKKPAKKEQTQKRVPPIKKEISKPKIVSESTGLYREIKNDRLIKGRIYFDGTLYTVQSSSWKSTSIAEREVRKLKKRGFDAFIYKVFIKSKNGTWNRVRVGYFKTKKEAEEFLKKNKI